jgi:predicted nucleic acid-binding protein
MPEAAAAIDASPLILLSRVGRLDLLLTLERRLIVPRPVLDEIYAKGNADPAAKSLLAAPYLEAASALQIPQAILRWGLGKGESSVLAWAAEHPGALALLDDLAARRCAQALAVPVLGTAGLVLLAKRRGAISSASAVLNQLREAGMYLSQSILATLKARAGEP